MIYGWTPGIGDPTPIGWATVAAYVVASALSARAATGARNKAEKRFWWLTALALFLLAVNKELDLQSLLTAIGKQVALEGGWYERRREVQLAFIAGVALLAVLAGAFMLRLARRGHAAMRWAIAGLVLIGAFVVIRAASFHRIEHWLGTAYIGVDWNWVLELGGIAVVALAALAYGLRGRRGRR